MKQTWKCEGCPVPCTLTVRDETRERFVPPRLCPYFNDSPVVEWQEIRRGRTPDKPRR